MPSPGLGWEQSYPGMQTPLVIQALFYEIIIPPAADRPVHTALHSPRRAVGAQSSWRQSLSLSSLRAPWAGLQGRAGESWDGRSESSEPGRERRRRPSGNDNALWVFPGSCRRSSSDLSPGQTGLLRSGSRISLTAHTQEQGTIRTLTCFPLAFSAPSMLSGSGEKSIVGKKQSSGGRRGRERLYWV